MKGQKHFRSSDFCLALGFVMLVGVVLGAAFSGQEKKLTIENNTVLPLKICLDPNPNQPSTVLGFVDPVSRKTFDFPLQDGRWYVTVEPYAPRTRYNALNLSLYVKSSQTAYVYEILEKHFSDKPILPPDNVSIVGKWSSGPWMNHAGFVVEFSEKGGGYVGTIVSIASKAFLDAGYFPGMVLVSNLRRTQFNRYDGTIKEFRRDGSLTESAFGVLIERGVELYPYGWTRK